MIADRFERTVVRLYRILLRLYSRSFRDGFAEDALITVTDRLRAERRRGRVAALWFVVAAVADVLVNALIERLTPAARSRGGNARVLRPFAFYGQDIRYALRLLARSPVFTALTIVVLGGGMGISIFTWSFLYTVALRPLPLPGGDRLVRVYTTGDDGGSTLLDARDVALVRHDAAGLAGIRVFTTRAMVMGRDGGGLPVQATAAEWDIFTSVGARPMLGRGFAPADGEPGAEPVIVLGHRMWRVGLGGDSGIVGRQVTLNGLAARVIGVMPPDFGFPVAAESWIPIAPELLRPDRPERVQVDAYARLADGVSVARAEAELSVLLARALARHPREASGRPAAPVIRLQSFPMAQAGDEGPLVLAALNATAFLIMLLACVNVANLLLARANERDREIAVRLALGAPRPRLIMQSMWESVILCLVGGTLATALAVLGLDFVNAWARTRLEGNLAFWWDWGFNASVVVASGVFVTVAVALLGGVVAVRASRTSVSAVLNDTGVRGGGRRRGRWSRALVVAQVATVTVLMFIGTMSGIVGSRVANVDLGYDTHNLLAAGMVLPEARYPTPDRITAGWGALAADVRGRREIEGVVLRAQLGEVGQAGGEVEIAGRLPASPGERPSAYLLAVDGPLPLLGIALRQGRLFDPSDAAGGARTALVSQAFADRHWAGESPIGRQVRLAGAADSAGWHTVVGVVSDVLMGNPLARDRSAEAVYLPLAQSPTRAASLLFRHRGDAAAAQGLVLEAITRTDPELVPGSVASFDEILSKTTLLARSVTRLFSGCFLFALLLAVSGTYGLMARAIGQRTREIGVRRALGATDGTVLRLLLGQGGRQLGVGAVIALPVTLLLGTAFSRYFLVAPSLAVAVAALVSLVITGVVLLATYVPTRRAVRIQPSEALWRE